MRLQGYDSWLDRQWEEYCGQDAQERDMKVSFSWNEVIEHLQDWGGEYFNEFAAFIGTLPEGNQIDSVCCKMNGWVSELISEHPDCSEVMEADAYVLAYLWVDAEGIHLHIFYQI